MEIYIISNFVFNEKTYQFTSCIELAMSWVWYENIEFEKLKDVMILLCHEFNDLEMNEYDFEWD